MLNSLLIAALIVIAMWVIIMGIYLLTSRRQLSAEDTIESLEQELDRAEKENG